MNGPSVTKGMNITPTKIVPVGPELDLDSPHGRDGLSGKGVFRRV